MANTKKYVSLDKLGLYDEKIKKVISDSDAATLASAKKYTDDAGALYDAAGSAATALESAKAYADGKDAAIAEAKKAGTDAAAAAGVADGKAVAAQGAVDALAGKVGTVPEGSTVMGIIANIQENAYDDTELRGLISGLDTNKADKTQVATDIGSAKTELEGKITTAQNAADAAQDDIDEFKGTYATDKAAIEGAIALKADQTALDAVSGVANAAVKQSDYNAKVEALEGEDARIEGLVTAEVAKAREEEGKLDARLAEVEAFFELAEGEKLDTALDTLVEIQNYIVTEGVAADQMVLDIAANKKAIEDHAATDHDFAAADATLKAELEGKINGKVAQGDFDAVEDRVEVAEGKITVVEGKVSTLEGQMSAAQGAIATKAEAQALTDAVSALELADTGLGNRIAALEAKHGDGEGTVESLIATAKQEAIDAAASAADTKDEAVLVAAKKYADDEDALIEARVATLETASATHALSSDLTALAGRVTTAEGEIDTLQSEMDAVEELAAAADAAAKANAAAIALKASQADLDAVSGRVTTLENWHSNFVECSQEDINGLFS